MIVVDEMHTCTTGRKRAALLRERGVDFERVAYHGEGAVLARPVQRVTEIR